MSMIDNIKNNVKRFIIKFSFYKENRAKNKRYFQKYKYYSFAGTGCQGVKQYEAVITRLYHTIEKGLAYEKYRAGFGEKNIDDLLETMSKYVINGYDKDAFFFKTALSALKAYVDKNKEYGVENPILEERINSLGGTPNNVGGAFSFCPATIEEIQQLGYKDFVESRHSVRHFSSDSVDMERVISAIELAQKTPSACNRQGWKTYIISDKTKMKCVLENQNGNRGFGHEIDKILLVTADLQYFNLDRELYQPYIDGGMYAQSLLNSLHYYRIASVPLSASLRMDQEYNIRRVLQIDESEVLVLFIGIGNYTEPCQTARSERHEARYTIE